MIACTIRIMIASKVPAVASSDCPLGRILASCLYAPSAAIVSSAMLLCIFF
jgi:hypothetical protein